MSRLARTLLGGSIGVAIVAALVWWSIDRSRASGIAAGAPATGAPATAASGVETETEELMDDARETTVVRAGRRPAETPRRASKKDVDDLERAELEASLAARLESGWILHGADPCDAVSEPEIPNDYETVTAEDVTVAWPITVDVAEPTLLAHVVAGLLEEAALLTDSDRRAHLTVMLHPTLDELRKATGAPKWADGLYDGAVHVVAMPKRDFGVKLEALRHEVMHAQTHTAAGCSPAWFNEGTAMLFERRPPTDGWKRFVRDGVTIDFASLSVPSVAKSAVGKQDDDVDVAYAESLAMVLYAKEHTADDRLDSIVSALRSGPADQARERARSLWTTLHPRITEDHVRDWLAHRIYDVDSASMVRSALGNAYCCWGERRISTYACRATTPRPDKKLWFDDTFAPSATCSSDAP